jgi:dipeptidyl aminopeptidase/acylaminoacyl peptidase
LTKDFKNYQKITELQPETKIKWLQAELLSWEQPNGIISQGVLYKPKDFDSTVKYPVIINYYQAFSHRLYEFPEPSWTGDAAINIPWFVSRGYLVFTPDIYYEEGYINRSANTTVVSAGEYLSKLPYVDGKRLGISGHSFGGMETYYIATHSNIFAAIFAGAGTSDLISSGLQLEGGYKKGNVRMQVIESYTKTSLWEDPDLFIEESAIFKADQVISPLLIFHCMSDGAVPFEQAVEMFTALRRLGKKCWMLQYDEGNHGVFGENARDLTTRVTQFFNFYLKGTPPPRWMSNGIRAMNKGVDTGLELDDTGKLP